MDLMTILQPALFVAGMGFVFAAGLAFASQKFAVEVDERIPQILDAVPGANCGGCGYPGCAGFANAVIDGKVAVNGCPVGGASSAEAIATIMGLDAGVTIRKVAYVKCKGDKEVCGDRFDYDGVTSCLAANMLNGGPKKCLDGCMGYGSCVEVCMFDAMFINDKGLAEVDPEKCTACNKCVNVCPKNVVELVPYSQLVVVDCSNKSRGPLVKKNCNVACIACGICQKNCPFDAIHVENNLAVIDYGKCKNCQVCVSKCPTKAIKGDLSLRKEAIIIEEKCIGCTICAKKCPVDAIEGELKKLHSVDSEKCIGCGVCFEKCPKNAIEMK